MILITGGMGFIGLHTAKRFVEAGEQVVITQFRTSRNPEFIKDEIGKRVFVESLDVANGHDVLSLIQKYNVTGIVHLIAPTLGKLSPAEEYRINTLSLINVLEAAKLSNIKRVSLASSVSIYSNVKTGPFFEDMPLPLPSTNSTEAFKKMWEVFGHFHALQTGLDVVMLRIGVIYGPLYHTLSNLPSRLSHAAVKGIEPNFSDMKWGVPYAEDEGDYCYVKDCARAIHMIQMADHLNHRVYNIGGGRPMKNQEIADAVKSRIPGAQIHLQAGASKNGRKKPYMDLSRIKEDVGFDIEYDIERGIADYIDWLELNPL